MGWLTGRHAINEAIQTGAEGVLYVVRKNPRFTELTEIASRNDVPVRFVTSDKLKRIAGPSARGIAFESSSTDKASPKIKDLKVWLQENLGELPSPILALDHVTDPHNLGAILRSAHWFDVPLVIIPERRSATGGDVVARASAGAVSLVPTAFVTNLRSALEECKTAGYWVYGADADGVILSEQRINTPTLLVLGAEGKGISPGLGKSIDGTIRIPRYGTQRSSVDSLNVSVSAGILLYALRESIGL